MWRLVLTLWVILLAPGWAGAVIGVAQSAAPTSNGGTQDLTVSGLGTASCAAFWTTYGTANGTGVDHALFAMGFSDFTNGQSVAGADEDAQVTTDTGGSSGATALRTLLNTSQAVDGTAAASAITNGARLTWSDAPPSAYLVNALIFGSSSVDNCFVGSLTASSTQDATASTTAPGFQPNLLFVAVETNGTSSRNSYGFAVDNAGIAQRSSGQASQNGQATSEIRQHTSSTYVAQDIYDNTTLGAWELTSFDINGFTVTTRNAAVGATLRYMAVKLKPALAAKIVNCSSPTATGAHACTGAGWTPQVVMLLHTESAAYNTVYTADDNEVFGVSACDATACVSGAINAEDGTGTTVTKSITSNVPVRLIKDGADWMTASSSGPQADGWNFNYSVAPGSAFVRGVLMIQAAAAAAPSMLLRRRTQ